MGMEEEEWIDLQIIQKQKIWKTYVTPVFGSESTSSLRKGVSAEKQDRYIRALLPL